MKKIILICSALFLFSSCEEYLEIEPRNEIALQNYDQIRDVFDSYLLKFQRAGNTHQLTVRDGQDPLLPFSYNAFTLFTVYTDDIELGTNLSVAFFGSKVYWRDRVGAANIWKQHFSALGLFNLTIDFTETTNATTAEKDIVIAEAKVQRAYNLFKLLQYFVPYNNAELGLPFNLDSSKATEGGLSIRRRTQAETYAAIIQDLEDALNTSTDPVPGYNLMYNKAFINGLLAKVYRYKAGSAAQETNDYTMAINYAERAMNGKSIYQLFPSTPPSIFSAGSYEDGVSHPLNPEAALLVFKQPNLIRDDFDENGGNQNIGQVRGTGISVSESFINLYSDTDIRRNSFITPSPVPWVPGEVIGKYAFELDFDFRGTFHLLTPSELVLILAESYAQSGDSTNAIEYLNMLREKRFDPYVAYEFTNQEDLVQEILNERRRELCFSYDIRWTDLTQLQTGWSRGEGNPDFEAAIIGRLGDNLPDPNFLTMGDNDFRFTLPIPERFEIDNNKIEQNPGW